MASATSPQDVKLAVAYTAIVSAINSNKLRKSKRLKRISTILENNGDFDINTVDPQNGRTLLHHSSRKGLSSVVEYLLNLDNMDLNIESKTGQTPLIEAVIGHSESHTGGNALFRGAKKQKSKTINHASCIELLLSSNKCDTEKKSIATGWTALHEASWQNYEVGVSLLSTKCDINCVSNENETPLMLAIIQQHTPICRIILKNEKTDINIPAFRHELGLITPLGMAARFGLPPTRDKNDFNSVIDLLLQRNAMIHFPQSFIDTYAVSSNGLKTAYSAIEHARQKGRWQIASKLLIHSLGERLGEQVMNTKFDIAKDRAMVHNMISIYNKQFVEDKDYMNFKMNIIQTIVSALNNYKPFSKDLLLIAYRFNFNEKGINNFADINSLNLWNILKEICINILTPPTRKFDFWWFRDNILNSSIWFEKYDGNYLYQELLNVVGDISKNEQLILKKELLETINKEEKEENEYWVKLKTFKYENDESKYDNAMMRQDAHFKFKEWTKDGLQATHYASYLNDESLNLGINITRYYDNKIYLPRLRFIAYLLNDEFQKTLKNMLLKNKRIDYEFQSGPLKTMERCLIKTETDYAMSKFPKTAKLLDIARCSITFKKCKDLFDGLIYIISEIEAQQTGFKLIARIKNTFSEINIVEPNYGDIKINAVFEYNEYCMIVEIQLLLQSLLKYKKRNHSLYNVERKEDFFRNVIHLNQMIKIEHSFFSAAAMGDIKTIFEAIKYNDMDVNIRDDNGDTPLFHAARSNRMKAMHILVEYGADVNIQNNAGSTCLYIAAEHGYLTMVKYLIFKCKANVNPTGMIKPPLLNAAFRNHFEIVKILVENKAIVTDKMLSISRRNHNIFEYLQQNKTHQTD